MVSPAVSATTCSIMSNGVRRTRAIATAIARALVAGDVVVLTGELGAGKTAMVQSIAEASGVLERVTSPTFAVHRTYRGDIDIHHLDAYRLGESMDVETAGLNEIFDGDGVVLIEWGERISGELPDDRIEIVMRYGETDDERQIDVSLCGNGWRRRGPDLLASLVNVAHESDRDGSAARESTGDRSC